MNSERKAFLDWLNSKYSEFNTFDITFNEAENCFNHMPTEARWEAWQASTQRQGYKLVPMEMSWQKADDLASKEWDKNKTMFCNENRDMTALQVEEFRLRWCKNKAHQIMRKYKAMIGAVDDHNESN